MRPGQKRVGAKPKEGSRYSRPRPKRDESVRIIKQIVVKEPEKKTDDNLVYGRNAVLEVLKSDRGIEVLYVAEGDPEGSLAKILGIARDKRLLVKFVDRRKLDQLTDKGHHQGVALRVTDFVYQQVEEILARARQKKEDPFLILLDEVEDPHNLGSIIRTAELCGAHGIIIPKRRSVGVTATVYKTSAGAVEHLPVARVTNLVAAAQELKKRGIFLYGADMAGEQSCNHQDFSGPCALVIGNEGKGISRLMRETCDAMVSIPMVGTLNSLNASVAAGIIMYEVMKGRLEKKTPKA
ncbi:23S rRNA (guanosine(2251)-2'-O)-methyltransferase [Clostridiaceae bacterium JG1575]|nr:23S rRNA (guanosine(2251)-2'-O)-methyltransferase [Clostridiaceae bacterium JG1575]